MAGNEELRKRASAKSEAQRVWMGENDPEALTPMALRAVMSELHVHQVELELQNEELLRTQMELEETHRRYFELYDLAPVGYFRMSDKGLLLEANLQGAQLLGESRSVLIGKVFSSFVAEADKDNWYLFWRLVVNTVKTEKCELRMASKGGTVFWARLEADTYTEPEGRSSFRIALSDITEAKRAEELLKHALAEKHELLRELQHRAKNSFSLVCTIIAMASQGPISAETKKVLGDLDSKVIAISELYSLLYSTASVSRVRLGDYCRRIASPLTMLPHVTLVTELEDITVAATLAAPIGLILTELVTNAVKHAFPGGKEGTIRVSLRATAIGAILEVRDDGRGLGVTENLGTGGSSGFSLMKGLTKQIDGRFQILSETEGTCCILEFPFEQGAPDQGAR
ncbi:MAG: sensor histidine kinase [Rectinemataceae bacterium]